MKLFLAIALAVVFASSLCSQTTWDSDGTEDNVQAIANEASPGDTITLPQGTFTWTKGVTLNQVGLTGSTTVSGAGGSAPTVNDRSIIIDAKPSPSPGSLLTVNVSGSVPTRITGLTFATPSPAVNTKAHQGAAIKVVSTGAGAATNVRIDHCHSRKLWWEKTLLITGWVYGVDDHNFWEAGTNCPNWRVEHSTWGGQTNGNGSWAAGPMFGSSNFWFIEDDTVTSSGGISGGIDCQLGGRFVARHTYFAGCHPNGHGTENSWVRGMRTYEVYDNVLEFTSSSQPIQSNRSGGGIWHDNTFRGPPVNPPNHTSLQVYRYINFVSPSSVGWGPADGLNPWDKNDTEGGDGHGLYFWGTVDSGGTMVSGGNATFNVDSSSVPLGQDFSGFVVRNENPASPGYKHASLIKTSNGTDSITYWYDTSGGHSLKFLAGDEFSIHRVIAALDQSGRGKGDLIKGGVDTPHWSNEQQETCYSWNNVNPSPNPGGTPQVFGFGDGGNPWNIKVNQDYKNLGAGFPVDTIPAEVSAFYTAQVNDGGAAYTHEFTYPHPLVAGASPTPTPRPSPIPVASPTSTPTVAPTAIPPGPVRIQICPGQTIIIEGVCPTPPPP